MSLEYRGGFAAPFSPVKQFQLDDFFFPFPKALEILIGSKQQKGTKMI